MSPTLHSLLENRDRRKLRAVAPATLVADPTMAPAVLEALADLLLAAQVGAAFVFDDHGAVYRANEAASAAGQEARELVEALQTDGGSPGRSVSLGAGLGSYQVVPLAARADGFRVYLAIAENTRRDTADRVRAFAERWQLSRRQSEILALLMEGHPNRAIAERLGLAVGTVEIHVSKVLRLTGADSRSQLAARVWGDPAA